MSPREPGAPEPSAWVWERVGGDSIVSLYPPVGNWPATPLYTADAALLMAAERDVEMIAEAVRIVEMAQQYLDHPMDQQGCALVLDFLRTLTDSERP